MTFVWSGTYSEIAAAVEASQSGQSDVFSAHTWLQRQAALVNQTSNETWTEASVQGRRPSSLPMLLAAAAPTDLIIDFGGGSGWVYSILQAIGLEPPRYVVMDLPNVTKYFQSHPIAGVEHKAFGNRFSIEGLQNRVMYANSSLQYAPDNNLLSEHIKMFRPNVLVIDELPWTQGSEDWFTVQRNSDISVVARFVSLPSLIEQMRELDLGLVWSGAFGSGHDLYAFPDMSNFPGHLAIDHGKSLVFRTIV